MIGSVYYETPLIVYDAINHLVWIWIQYCIQLWMVLFVDAWMKYGPFYNNLHFQLYFMIKFNEIYVEISLQFYWWQFITDSGNAVF